MIRQFLKQPKASQAKTLKRLLKRAANSAFGQKYDFEKIINSEDPVKSFQSNVPIFTYDKLNSEWWDNKDDSHMHNTWMGHFKYFAQSSGTSGASSKKIPITNETIKTTRATTLKILKDLRTFGIPYKMFLKDKLMLGGSLDLEKSDGLEFGDLSGIYANNLPTWMKYYYMPGKEIGAIRDWDTKLSRIVEEAPNWDISFIVGMPSWLLLTLEKIVEHYKVDTIHDIWPNLSVFIHGGVHLDAYIDSFRRILAKDLIYINTYLASEGFIAYQQRPEYKGMNLIMNAGIFFEFIEFNENNFDSEGSVVGTPKVLGVDEIEEGVDYALLMSTTNGLWRYIIGDTIKFINKEKLELLITGRVSQFLNICGEHLSVANMNDAIKKAEKELDVQVREFTVHGYMQNNTVIHTWHISQDKNKIDPEIFKTTLDKHLQELNDDYSTERKHILKVELEVVDLNQFYAWQAKLGKMGGQNKFPRVMNTKRHLDWSNFLKGN